VFGEDYNTPDGTAIRDYIHVVDLAQAHVVAVSRMIEKHMKKPFEIFNLGTGNGFSVLEVIKSFGTGNGFSVLEVIKSFEKVSASKLNYKIVGRRAGDVEQVWADPAFSNEELGWKAKKSLDEMTASAWKWEQVLRKGR